MTITQPRFEYKPFEYTYADALTQSSIENSWNPHSIELEQDLTDFQNSSLQVQNLIGGLLRAFVLLEPIIGDYWSNINVWFPKYEIVETARMYAAEEVRHARAYFRLEDSLGVSNYSALMQDPVSQAKFNYFVEHPNPLVSLAVFSGFGEGVSLYGSFAILKSFCRAVNGGKFSGVGQIISYSAREEKTHSDFGCWLFKALVAENSITHEEIEEIETAFIVGLDNEFRFLDSIFEGNRLDEIDVEELKTFLLHLAVDRLKALDLNTSFLTNYFGDLGEDVIGEWFFPSVELIVSHDFFDNFSEGSNYATLSSTNWESQNYTQVIKKLEALI